MKRIFIHALVAAVLVALCRPGSAQPALSADVIGKAASAETTVAPDGVVRIAWPRKDVSVEVDSVAIKPFAGLGSWAAFKATEHGAMLMGDTVVFEDEVDAAIDAAQAGGLEVTAIHNHFFFDQPHVFFMHIGGHGDPAMLAAGVKGVWDAIKKVRTERPEPASLFSKEDAPEAYGKVDAAPIEAILGQKATAQDGIVKVTIGRTGKMMGVEVGGSMGLTTWMAFSGTNELAAVDGDFIMSAGEIQTVIKELRHQGIHVVALHNHMVGEAPAFFFTHFWGKGPATDLAKKLKSVLDAQSGAAKAK